MCHVAISSRTNQRQNFQFSVVLYLCDFSFSILKLKPCWLLGYHYVWCKTLKIVLPSWYRYRKTKLNVLLECWFAIFCILLRQRYSISSNSYLKLAKSENAQALEIWEKNSLDKLMKSVYSSTVAPIVKNSPITTGMITSAVRQVHDFTWQVASCSEELFKNYRTLSLSLSTLICTGFFVGLVLTWSDMRIVLLLFWLFSVIDVLA